MAALCRWELTAALAAYWAMFRWTLAQAFKSIGLTLIHSAALSAVPVDWLKRVLGQPLLRLPTPTAVVRPSVLAHWQLAMMPL